MFFLIFGIKDKVVAKENRKVLKNGFEVNAIITVYKKYIELFFIPIFPIKTSYSMYIPHSDEYFEAGNISQIPKEYLDICKDVANMH